MYSIIYFLIYFFFSYQMTEERDRSVLLGMHYRNENETTRIRIGVAEVLVHEEFDPSTYEHDIMLLKLQRPVQYTAEISPICLPEKIYSENDRLRCYTTGWGHTTSKSDSEVVLQEISNKCWC